MGKKRIIKKSEQELIEEAKRDSAARTLPAQSGKGKGMREGRISIYSSYNNTQMTLADPKGNVVFITSAGTLGFKGNKKSTPFAASKVAETLTDVAKNRGIEKIAVTVRGIGPGRESALRSLGTKGFEIISIRDVTPVPHNGPRPRKVRRV